MMESSVVWTLSAMSVSRRYGPTFRPSMKSTLNSLDVRLAQTLERDLGDLLVAPEQDLAGFLVDDVFRADLADELGQLERQAIDVRRPSAS